MKKARALKSAKQRTAIDRVSALFEQARIRPAYAKRYVVLARKIASRYKVRIPEQWRRRFCKDCNALLVPGRNCRVRTVAGKIVIRCLECGGMRRIPIKR